MRRPTFVIVAVMLSSWAGGCGPAPLVQVETAVRPDGSCERSIWQPRGRLLPEEAFTADWLARWGTIADVAAPPAFPEMATSSGEAYFHARGVFASPADIPRHFLKGFENRPDLGAGESTHQYRRRDFGLFVEHRWSETLASGVTREGFETGRDELLDLAMPMLALGVEQVYGRDYDVDAAIEELERRGRPLFRELIDAWYGSLAAAGDPKAAETSLIAGFVAAAERAGVPLHDEAGEIVGSPEWERRVGEHLAARVASTFRRKDGTPPTPEQIGTIVGPAWVADYIDAWNRFATGREAEINAKLVPPLARMTGPYFFPPLLGAPTPRFAFDVRLPGRLIRDGTNGEIDEAAGSVSWRFEATRIFPEGYTMTARSIETDGPAQRRLPGRVALIDARAATAVAELLADDPETAELLRRASESGDASDLRETSDMDASRRSRLARLRDLLGLRP